MSLKKQKNTTTTQTEAYFVELPTKKQFFGFPPNCKIISMPNEGQQVIAVIATVDYGDAQT